MNADSVVLVLALCRQLRAQKPIFGRDCDLYIIAFLSFLNPGMWDPKRLSFQNLQRAGLIGLEHVARDPSSQVGGISIIIDYEGLTLDKVFGVSFSQLRQGLEYLQVLAHHY